MQITRVFCARGSYASILCKWQEYSVQQNCNFHHAVSSVTCKALCVQCSEPKCIDCSLPALALAFQPQCNAKAKPQCNAKAKPCKANVATWESTWQQGAYIYAVSQPQPSSPSDTSSQVYLITCVNCMPSARHAIWAVFSFWCVHTQHRTSAFDHLCSTACVPSALWAAGGGTVTVTFKLTVRNCSFTDTYTNIGQPFPLAFHWPSTWAFW